MSTNSIRSVFSTFIAADDVEPIISSFDQLTSSIPPLSSSTPFYSTLRDSIVPDVPFKMKRLFQQLDERWVSYSTERTKVLNSNGNKCIAVSGAGPCGLRTAVELAIMGFDVTVVEKRGKFSRHNILKTWMPTVEDLIALGLKCYFPNFQQHGLHCIGTKEIQLCLLKSALLFGVRFIYSQSVAAIVDPIVEINGEKGTWRLVTNSIGLKVPLSIEETSAKDPTSALLADPSVEDIPAELALKVGEQNVERLDKHSKVDFFEKASTQDGAVVRTIECLPEIKHVLSFDSLVVAEGETTPLVRNLGFDRAVTRFGPAIGIVVNMVFDQSSPIEKKLQEFVVYHSQADWADTCIGKLSKQGVEVENLEYMRLSTHFMVATVKKESLIKFGVLLESKQSIQESLTKENINLDRLREFARFLATAVGVPQSTPFASDHGVNIFDFSCKGRLYKPCTFLTSSEGQAGPWVLPVGDALVNSFWPQGLGVNRGFHSSLDVAWSLYLNCVSTQEEAVLERDVSFRMMMWFPNLEVVFVKSGVGWRADPLTRYATHIPMTMHMNDVSYRTASSLTPRILASITNKK